jgi:hypothetical protein
MRMSLHSRPASRATFINAKGRRVAVDPTSSPLRIAESAELWITCVTSPVSATSGYDPLLPAARKTPPPASACETAAAICATEMGRRWLGGVLTRWRDQMMRKGKNEREPVDPSPVQGMYHVLV